MNTDPDPIATRAAFARPYDLAVPLVHSQASVDRRISMRVVLARTLIVEGRADQARDVVNVCMELAYADSPFAISQALTGTSPALDTVSRSRAISTGRRRGSSLVRSQCDRPALDPPSSCHR